MDSVKIILKNIKGTLLLLGLFFFLMAIVGQIDTQWIKTDFSNLFQRGSLVSLGVLSIVLCWFIDKRPFSANNGPAVDSAKKPSLDSNSTFEWQWAAENMYGRVRLERLNNKNVITQVKMGLIQKTLEQPNMEARILMDGMVLQMAPNSQGTFEITDNGIELDFMAQKKNRRTGQINLENIKGSLSQVPCYAGRVTFSSNEGTYAGDMILVGYESQLGSHVNDWFKNEQKWYDKYLLDR